MKKITTLILFLTFCWGVSAQTLPVKSEIIKKLKLVNEYWMDLNVDPGNNQWARATYFTGILDFYKLYPKKEYIDYINLWANNHSWRLNGGISTRHADNHCVGQVYLDLYLMDEDRDDDKIIEIGTSINNMLASDKVDDWWWIDALYMAMPVFTRLGNITGDTAFYDRMYEMYYDTKVNRDLYNSEVGLWYRDQTFAPPYTTPNGLDSYWSRGNGWVFGAHVRVLQLLPETDSHRDEYIETFQKMAEALKANQREDGFWNVSLVDPNDYGGIETSGTSFFTYGMAWGINNGILDSATYYPVVVKAWEGLSTQAVQENGYLSFIQGVGSNPASSQPVTLNSTADFGIGAFLLAGTELVKLAVGEMVVPNVFYIDSLVVDNSTDLIVYFSKDLDIAMALEVRNYQIDNEVVITNVELYASNAVKISTTGYSFGLYELAINKITSTEADVVDEGETETFVYSGVKSVHASSYEEQSSNIPSNTLDVNLDTRWSASGMGEWIRYDLGTVKLVKSVDMAFFKGNERRAIFQIYLSKAGEDSVMVFNGESSGTSLYMENFEFEDKEAQYVTVVGFGNTKSDWNSITETRINYDIIASVKSEDRREGLIVHPNPIINDFAIKGDFVGLVDISIINLKGKVITQFVNLDAVYGIINISSVDLPEGVYLLEVQDELSKRNTFVVVR